MRNFSLFFKMLRALGGTTPAPRSARDAGVALLTLVTGCRTGVDVEDFGREWEEWQRQFLALEIPSLDTFVRPFSKPSWARLHRTLGRRSFEVASERSSTHLLRAFVAESKLMLAKVVVRTELAHVRHLNRHRPIPARTRGPAQETRSTLRPPQPISSLRQPR